MLQPKRDGSSIVVIKSIVLDEFIKQTSYVVRVYEGNIFTNTHIFVDEYRGLVSLRNALRTIHIHTASLFDVVRPDNIRYNVAHNIICMITGKQSCYFNGVLCKVIPMPVIRDAIIIDGKTYSLEY